MSKASKAPKVDRGGTPPPPNISPALERQLGDIEYWPLDRLTPYAGNPRLHPERQVVALTASMHEFGIAFPFLTDEHGTLICGHARLEAARRLGVTEVPVLVARYWSAQQVKSYRLADNRLAQLGSWSAELLKIEIAGIIEIAEVPVEVMGWSTGEIDVILDGESAGVGNDPADEVPAPPAAPVSRIGDLWKLGDHRLLCGSSLEADSWTRLMSGKVGALCLSDGPFNCKINGHVSGTKRFSEFAMASGEMTFEQFIDFNTQWLNASKAVLKDGALVMAFMDHAHLYELMTAGRNAGLHHLNMCIWAKTNGGMGSPWRSQYELVLVLKHGTAPHTDCVNLGRHGRYRTNIWTCAGANAFGPTRDADLADHPTVKPQKLLAEAIRDVTRSGDIVIDAFSGSGSTILACERTKRLGYAIEIEPRYVDVAIRRWEDATGQQASLETTGQTFTQMRESRLLPS